MVTHLCEKTLMLAGLLPSQLPVLRTGVNNETFGCFVFVAVASSGDVWYTFPIFESDAPEVKQAYQQKAIDNLLAAELKPL
jgi:hypothetical protein